MIKNDVTILSLSSPILILTKILGVAPYTLNNSPPTIEFIYTLYSFTLPTSCLLTFLLSPISRTPLRLLHDISNISAFFICLTTLFIAKNCVIKLLQKLQSLHSILSPSDERQRKLRISSLIWTVISTAMFIINIAFSIITDGKRGVYFAALYYFPNFILTTISLQFAFFLNLIISYLKRLIFIFKNNKPLNGGRTTMRMNALIDIRKLYSELWLACRLLNISYSLVLTVIFTSTFMNITETAYFWLNADFSNNWMELFDSGFWMLSNVLRILFIAIICERIKHKVTELAQVIHTKLLDVTDEDEYNLLLQFSLQLIHEDISFWACGLFQINNTLLYGMLGAITTYSVLIFQLKAH